MISLPTLALLFAGGAGAADDGEWAAVWSTVQAAHRGEPVLVGLRAQLPALPEGARRDVLAFHVDALTGGSPAAIQCERLPALEDGGAWAFALALSPGVALDEALLSALAACGEGDLPPLLARGYIAFLAHTERADAAPAVALGRALHARARAVWSAQNLTMAHTRAGGYEAAASVLLEALKAPLSGEDRSLLRSRLVLVYLGQEGLSGARGALGATLSQGIGDSGIVLGLLSLEGGRRERARALFRSVLGRDPTQPWAARGWGLSMVPR